MKKLSHLAINKKKSKGGKIMHQRLRDHGQYGYVLMPLEDLPLEERIEAIVAEADAKDFAGVDVIRPNGRLEFNQSIHAVRVG